MCGREGAWWQQCTAARAELFTKPMVHYAHAYGPSRVSSWARCSTGVLMQPDMHPAQPQQVAPAARAMHMGGGGGGGCGVLHEFCTGRDGDIHTALKPQLPEWTHFVMHFGNPIWFVHFSSRPSSLPCAIRNMNTLALIHCVFLFVCRSEEDKLEEYIKAISDAGVKVSLCEHTLELHEGHVTCGVCP